MEPGIQTSREIGNVNSKTRANVSKIQIKSNQNDTTLTWHGVPTMDNMRSRDSFRP